MDLTQYSFSPVQVAGRVGGGGLQGIFSLHSPQKFQLFMTQANLQRFGFKRSTIFVVIVVNWIGLLPNLLLGIDCSLQLGVWQFPGWGSRGQVLHNFLKVLKSFSLQNTSIAGDEMPF